VASPGFGVRRGTERHRYNLSHTPKITQNNGYTVLQKNPIGPIPFSFFFQQKKKNKLILITVVRKILSTFDMRYCLHTLHLQSVDVKKRSNKNKKNIKKR